MLLWILGFCVAIVVLLLVTLPKKPTYAWTYYPPLTSNIAGKETFQEAICMNSYGATVKDAKCSGQKPPPRTTTFKNGWSLVEFPECTKDNAGKTVKQTVVCKDQYGNIVSDSYCNADPKPYMESKTCPTYKWIVSETLCTNTNVGQNTPNQIKCMDSNGNTVDDTFCELSQKPVETTTNCPMYMWKVTGEFPACTVDNQNQTYTQKIECVDENGKVVSNNKCPPDSKPTAQTIKCPWYTWERFDGCNESNVGQEIMQTIKCVNATTKEQVPDSFCPAEYKPSANLVKCSNFVWKITDMPACGLLDDGKTISQRIVCVDRANNDSVVSDSKCVQTAKPASSQLQTKVCPVKTYEWKVQNPILCGGTNAGKTYTQRVYCVSTNSETNQKNEVPDMYCNPAIKPVALTRKCPDYRWMSIGPQCPSGGTGATGSVQQPEEFVCIDATNENRVVSEGLCNRLNKPVPKMYACPYYDWEINKPVCTSNTVGKPVSGSVVCVNKLNNSVVLDSYCSAGNKPSVPTAQCPTRYDSAWNVERCSNDNLGIKREYSCDPTDTSAYTFSESYCAQNSPKPEAVTCYGTWRILNTWRKVLYEYQQYLKYYPIPSECINLNNAPVSSEKCNPALMYQPYYNDLTLERLDTTVDSMEIIPGTDADKYSFQFYVVVPKKISKGPNMGEYNRDIGIRINDVLYRLESAEMYSSFTDNYVKEQSNIIKSFNSTTNTPPYEVLKLFHGGTLEYPAELANQLSADYDLDKVFNVSVEWFPSTVDLFRFSNSTTTAYPPSGYFKYVKFLQSSGVYEPALMIDRKTYTFSSIYLSKRLSETVIVIKEIRPYGTTTTRLVSDGVYMNNADAEENSSRQGYYLSPLSKVGPTTVELEESRASFTYTFLYYPNAGNIVFDVNYFYMIELYNNIDFQKKSV